MLLSGQYLTLADPLRHFLKIVRGIFLKGNELGIWPQMLTPLAIGFGILTVITLRFRRGLEGPPQPILPVADPSATHWVVAARSRESNVDAGCRIVG